MQERLNVKISVEITTPDGAPFNNNVVEYFDMPYEHVLVLERMLIDALKGLNDFGTELADKAKKAKGNVPL